ncbi:fructose-bisphosphatase class II [Escherichia coli]
MPDSEVDVLYGIGGAPEGVVSAAVIRIRWRHERSSAGAS